MTKKIYAQWANTEPVMQAIAAKRKSLRGLSSYDVACDVLDIANSLVTPAELCDEIAPNEAPLHNIAALLKEAAHRLATIVPTQDQAHGRYDFEEEDARKSLQECLKGHKQRATIGLWQWRLPTIKSRSLKKGRNVFAVHVRRESLQKNGIDWAIKQVEQLVNDFNNGAFCAKNSITL